MTPITVMTFNIRGAHYDADTDNAWQNRALLNIVTIKKRSPDLIGFQEYEVGNQEAYDEHLTDYAYELGVKYVDQGERGMYNAIYWKTDRFEKLDSGGFYISPTPEKWSFGWDAAVIRSANWVRLKEKGSGTEFIFFDHHLDHIGEQARVEGAKLVIQRINDMRKETAYPVIVTADFNSRAWGADESVLASAPAPFERDMILPAETVYNIFKEAGYSDTFTAAGNENTPDTNTFHGFHGRGMPPVGLRIDWILTLDGAQTIKTNTCEIIRDEQPPNYPSDHYPVLAEIMFENV